MLRYQALTSSRSSGWRLAAPPPASPRRRREPSRTSRRRRPSPRRPSWGTATRSRGTPASRTARQRRTATARGTATATATAGIAAGAGRPATAIDGLGDLAAAVTRVSRAAAGKWNVFVIGDMLAEVGRSRPRRRRLAVRIQRPKEDPASPGRNSTIGKALPKIIESNEVDVAVVIIGTNDGRPMKSADKSSSIPFGSPEWRPRGGGRPLHGHFESADRTWSTGSACRQWAREHDAAVKIVNEVQRDRAAANGVRFRRFPQAVRRRGWRLHSDQHR